MRRLLIQNYGYTLIEVLISMILLAIVMTGGMAFYTNAMELTTIASHKKIATYLANAQLEAVRRKGIGNPDLPSDGDPPKDCIEINPEIDIDIGDLSTAITCGIARSDTGSPLEYSTFQVTVAWNEAGGSSRDVQFTTFMAP